MNPLLILLLAMAVVVGGVLLLRLHAVVALLAGAFLVALLTPSDDVYQHEIRRIGLTIENIDEDGGVFNLRPGSRQQMVHGIQVVFRTDEASGEFECLGTAELFGDPSSDVEPLRLLPEDPSVKFQPGDIFVHHTHEVAACKIADQTIGERVARGFGGTCTKIGILIALAAIIGKCLLESGAAQRIVMSVTRFFGDDRAPVAFVVSGFVVGIPVFFDTVFYLLIPLGKALRSRTGRDYLLYVLAIVVGASMAHSLVPPTPGPLFVASELGVSIGLMMLGGIAVGVVAVAAGYAYAVLANRWWELLLRDAEEATRRADTQTNDEQPKSLPPFWLAILPILLPVVLLGGKTFLDMLWSDVPVHEQSSWLRWIWPGVRALGDKNVALALATLAALLMLGKSNCWNAAANRTALQSALLSGGAIVLITASGGALGHVLRQTGISAAIQQHVPATGSGLTLLLLAFGITTIVRIAQGSATVAMITAVSVIAPIAASVHLPYHPMYLALAIGCGSKPFPWMNDSGFWVVSQMSGMTEKEALKSFSVAVSIMGVAGIAATMLGAWLLPLV